MVLGVAALLVVEIIFVVETGGAAGVLITRGIRVVETFGAGLVALVVVVET